jgi:cellulose synthase/poly-beta-1,6-N-acetylglucosamine synthase-like glycosyltransferase
MTLGLLLPVAYLTIISGYLLLLTLGAWCYRPKVNYAALESGEALRFALVIPAHNESGQIETILHDAKALDYPAGAFTTIVIADNCTDDTADRARLSGATVLERHDLENRGKGQALDWMLRQHQELLRKFEGLAIVDADMEMDAGFLRELAASLAASPAIQVAQALNAVSDPAANWRSAIGYMAFNVINHVRPAGRCFLGGTGELKGSGMAFRTALLLEYGWPAHSLTEDVEFSKQLLLDGVLVTYNPRAKVESAIPTTRAQADIQQARWEGGKLYLLRKYLPIFARKALPGQWRFIDALLDLLVPPQSILTTLLVVCLLLSLAAHPAMSLLLAVDLAAVAFCIASGLILRRAPFKVWLYLAAIPVFLAWKLPLLARVLIRRRPTAWQRTPRDEEL